MINVSCAAQFSLNLKEEWSFSIFAVIWVFSSETTIYISVEYNVTKS